MVKAYEPLYTVKEAAKVLKVNVSAVYRLINTKQLVGLRLGSVKVRGSDLERFLKQIIRIQCDPGYEAKEGKGGRVMAKIKNYDGQTGMELSYVAVQATRPKKKTVDWVGITETFIAGGMWVIVFMMLGAALAVQVL